MFEDENIDPVIAPPDVAVVSDEKAMDEEDLVNNLLDLPDAAGEIEIHRNVDKPEAVSFSVNSSYKKIKKTKICLKRCSSQLFFFICQEITLRAGKA